MKTFIRARDVRLLIRLELDRRRLVKSIDVHREKLGLSETQLEDAIRDLDSFLRFRREFPNDPSLAHDAQAQHERVLANRKRLIGLKLGISAEEKQRRIDERAAQLAKAKAARDAVKAAKVVEKALRAAEVEKAKREKARQEKMSKLAGQVEKLEAEVEIID